MWTHNPGDDVLVNETSYHIVKLLGHGKGGYSYLAERQGHLYVLKQIHHEPCDYYHFGNKIEAEYADYQKLKNAQIRIPELYDIDFQNERLIKAYISGLTIYEMICDDQSVERYLNQVEEMAAQAYAHHLNIDYFPTNFVVQENVLYYIDYECNTYMEEWSFERWGKQYWSKSPAFCDILEKQP